MTGNITPETDASCGYALSSHYGRLEGSYLQMDRSGPFVHAEVARKLERQRDEIQGKYDNEATEHMLAINKICNERDILRLDAQKEDQHHDRMVGELERVYAERDDALNQIQGWENKWKVAVDMAAKAEIKCDDFQEEIANLQDQRDLAMKVIKRLEANQP